MKRFTALDMTIVVVTAIIIALGCYNAALDLGMERGAKIGMALASPDGYRASEVRGSCENLFDSDECVECHAVK